MNTQKINDQLDYVEGQLDTIVITLVDIIDELKDLKIELEALND